MMVFVLFSPFTLYYFAAELRNNFMFMWYRYLSIFSVNMIWNNSVESEDVRTLHLLIAKQATCR